MEATPRNMKRLEDAGVTGVVAFSDATHAEYSATAGDYWQIGDDEVLHDIEDQPMRLVLFERRAVDADRFLPSTP